MFDDISRYKDLPVKTHINAEGSERRYVARRFVPDPASMRAMTSAVVTDTERLDLIANRTLGDATLFWRIADANAAMDSVDLLSPDERRLIVPNPI